MTGWSPAKRRELALAAGTSAGQARAALDAARFYSTMRADLASLGYPQPWKPGQVPIPAGTYADQGRALAGVAQEYIAAASRLAAKADLPSLVEGVFGADVAIIDLDDGFDGLKVSSADAKLIILGTSPVPWRQRYTLAHELCHLLASDDQEIHLDKDVFDKARGKDASEIRANAFAAAFLMPEDRLRSAVGTTGLSEAAFARLACELEVSPSALAIRLSQLRLIDAGTCDRFKVITGAKAATMAGQGEEFARMVAKANTLRSPGLLVRDAYAAYESGASTLRPYASLLGVDVDELRLALESEDGVHEAE